MTTRASTPTDGRVEFLQPEGLHRNPAFSNVAVVSGSVRTIYVGNALGFGRRRGEHRRRRRYRRSDRAGPCAICTSALAAAGAEPEHVVKWTIFIVDGQDFRAGYAAFQRVWGDRADPPVITAAVVKGLAHPDFLVEMDAIAVVPA